MTGSFLFRLGCAALVPLLSSACAEAPKSSNLVAEGDKFEVAAGELDQILRGMPPLPKELIVPTRKAVLQQLIAQKLLAEAAKAKDLEKNPEVMQQLEAARRTVLAAAYTQTLTGDLATPSDLEVRQFITANPQRYAQRKRFLFDEVLIDLSEREAPKYQKAFDEGGVAELRRLATASGKPINVLKGEGQTDSGLFAANSKLANIKPGETIGFNTGSVYHFMTIGTVTDIPMAVPDNLGNVAATILATRRQTIVEREIARLMKEKGVTVNDKALD